MREGEWEADLSTVQQRLSQVEGHLARGRGSAAGGGMKQGRASLLEKNPDDVSSSTPIATRVTDSDAVGRRHLCTPHPLHQRRKGRPQGHAGLGSPARRLQGPHRSLRH